MKTTTQSAEDSTIVPRNRAIDTLRFELHRAVHVERRLTVKEISERSGVCSRRITSYISSNVSEQREAPLSAALSILVVLGSGALNRMLALIGYGGANPFDEPEENNLPGLLADGLAHFSVIASAAADGRIDSHEEQATTEAADALIARILPLSSARGAV